MMDNPTQIAYVQSLDTIKARLYQLNHIDRLSWRKIAKKPEFSGIPAGTLCSISKGREPKENTVRVILGLPALAPAPVCSKCGEVHMSKTCPNDRKPAAVRVRHICENCAWWQDRRIEFPTREEGRCCYVVAIDAAGGDLYPNHDFGSRFWKRKEGAA